MEKLFGRIERVDALAESGAEPLESLERKFRRMVSDIEKADLPDLGRRLLYQKIVRKTSRFSWRI